MSSYILFVLLKSMTGQFKNWTNRKIKKDIPAYQNAKECPLGFIEYLPSIPFFEYWLPDLSIFHRP